MKINRINRKNAKYDQSRANYFVGEVNTEPLVTEDVSSELDLLNVYFDPGARTRPHSHRQDQVLMIIEGRGIVATETEKHTVTAGDIITIPAGTWHWHGATPHNAMTHISVMKRGQTDWMVEDKNWGSNYSEE